MYDVAILGGGLAGLTNAYLLTKVGYKVILFEKGSYPQHKVCGEYISNEERPHQVKFKKENKTNRWHNPEQTEKANLNKKIIE